MDDKSACAELIQAWGLYRDQGKWPQLLATFLPEGEIAVSWFSGSFREFVDRCRQSFEAGQRSKHHIFPSVVRVARDRALAETSIVILVRQKIGGVLTDITAHARFLDRLERSDGRWAIAERAAIYERDRLDPVEPSEAFAKLFAATDLSAYPEPYRYMAARLKAAGRALSPGRALRRRTAHGAFVRALRRLAGRRVTGGQDRIGIEPLPWCWIPLSPE
jgi:SnoaL-like domain